MLTEFTLDDLRKMACQKGLSLSADELKKLLPRVHRSRQQVLQLRELLSDEIEPAAHFPAAAGK